MRVSGRAGSADLFAEVGVGDAEGEEGDREGEEDEVGVHGGQYLTAGRSRLIKRSRRSIKKTSSPGDDRGRDKDT